MPIKLFTTSFKRFFFYCIHIFPSTQTPSLRQIVGYVNSLEGSCPNMVGLECSIVISLSIELLHAQSRGRPTKKYVNKMFSYYANKKNNFFCPWGNWSLHLP